MVLRLDISPQAELELRRRAGRVGLPVEDYAARQVERMLLALPSVAEVSGSAAAEFEASGLTEDDLSDFLEDCKHEMRRSERSDEDRPGEGTRNPD